MKGTGKTDIQREGQQNSTMTEQSMKEVLRMGNGKGMDDIYGRMEWYIKVNSSKG